MRIAVNGTIDTTTYFVTKLEYLDGLIYQENINNDWWYKTAPSGTWGPTNPLPSPLPTSPNGTTLTGTNGQIVDGNGNVWSLVSTPNDGLRVALNGIVDPTYNFTAFVTKLEYAHGKIYQENVANQWWYKIIPSTPWTPTSAPANTPTVYSWLGYPAFLNNPYAWLPFGVPGDGDVGVIASGFSAANGYNPATYNLGASYSSNDPAVGAMPIMELINAQTNIAVPTDDHAIIVNLGTSFTSMYIVPGAPGAAPYPTYLGGALFGQNYGTWIMNVTVGGELAIDNRQGTLAGNFTLGGAAGPYRGDLYITGGKIIAATINTTYEPATLYISPTTTIGDGVTINYNWVSGKYGTPTATVDGTFTSSNDTINIGGPGFNLGGPTISFLGGSDPAPETTNMSTSGSPALDQLTFQASQITAATYDTSSNTLTLSEVANGQSGTVPLHVSLQANSNPSAWELVESAPNGGVVQASLVQTTFPITLPPGGTIIHVI